VLVVTAALGLGKAGCNSFTPTVEYGPAIFYDLSSPDGHKETPDGGGESGKDLR
jgi:hypothetical protein